jgi:soluble lytic murein transglycosylase-like protein
MRQPRSWLGLLLALVVVPRSARAGDIGDAVRFAQEVMGDEAIEGLEEYIERDSDEALSILISERGGEADGEAPFETLGPIRLSAEALKAPIRDAAATTGLPAALIDAVIRTESGYRPRAVSRAGAIGLMQLMPSTARTLGVQDPFDVRQNIMGGSRYLRKLLDRFGSLKLAIAAYNAGPAMVDKFHGVPPFQETVRYTQVVLGRYEAARIERSHSTAIAPLERP